MESHLKAWESFYVIVGSSAGALTGLQFVVMTLIAEAGPRRGRSETLSAFGTPNVVHFCAALLIAAILSVPWAALRPGGLAVAVCGLVGLWYSIGVWRRARRQREYQPVWEDWVWHNILPLLAYATVFIAGLELDPHPEGPMLAIGAATLLLVFIGVHNAWDTVTYLMLLDSQRAEAGADAPPPARVDTATPPARGPVSVTASAPPAVAPASAGPEPPRPTP